MGEDQDAARTGGIDEADGCHRLAGAGCVLEPEPPLRPGVLGGLDRRLLGSGLVLPVLRLLVGADLVLVLRALAVRGGRILGGGRRGAAVAAAGAAAVGAL